MNEHQIKAIEELGDASHNANRVADTLLNGGDRVEPAQLVETVGRLLAVVAVTCAAFEMDDSAIFNVADKHVGPFKAIFPKLADE
jgi:hypothetical protein